VLIEVLYVPGCPNREPAIDRLKEALRSESVAVAIQEIQVTGETMARSLLFPGSPTIRVNGMDVEPTGQMSVGLACRLYSNGSGVPQEERLRHAISKAKAAEGKA